MLDSGSCSRQGAQITTFGPYSPGQAVVQKRMGIEAIYLGGWATSAKGSLAEDPGPDLASYPLSQVPDEAAGLVRALLTADRNQHFARSRMDDGAATRPRRKSTSVRSSSPTPTPGHGGDAHVRNLIRRFVEVGVPGYHIEDQKPGAKKCGHQGGKVLVAQDEQNKRLNAARFQLDIMRVAGHHRRPDRCRVRDVPRQPQRRAGPAVHPRGDEPRAAELSGRLPGDPEALHDLGLDEIRATCCSRCPRHESAARPTPGSHGSGSWRSIERSAQDRSARSAAATSIDELLDGIDDPVRRDLAGRSGPQDLWRGGRRASSNSGSAKASRST